MSAFFRSKHVGIARWLQRGVERLRRLLAVDRQAEALVLIPIRTEPPNPLHRRQQRAWRD